MLPKSDGLIKIYTKRGENVAEIKGKHPNWFKMKLERRELIRQLSPETAVNVLLACWDFLETGEKPKDMSPIESIAFASFMPDMDEAWSRYLQRVSARKQHRSESDDIDRYRMTSTETEEEPEKETEPETDSKKERVGTDKPPRPRRRFVPPTVEEVAEYVRTRGSSVDPQGFIDFYAAKGWMIGKTPMKDWKAACRNAESWERWTKKSGQKGRARTDADYEGGDSFV